MKLCELTVLVNERSRVLLALATRGLGMRSGAPLQERPRGGVVRGIRAEPVRLVETTYDRRCAKQHMTKDAPVLSGVGSHWVI